MRLKILCCLAALALPVFADAADEKLGEAYTNAEPAAKLVMLSIAKGDKVLDYKEADAANLHVVLTSVAAGENAEAQLRILGDLRSRAIEELKAANAARKEAGERSVSFVEPATGIQQALAVAYLAESAGVLPSIDALAGLALVRECTSWGATTSVVFSHASEALARDAAFREADLRGKLAIIKNMAEERQMLSDHERTLIEKSVLAEWIASRLAGEATSEQLAVELKDLKGSKMVCFFTSSWADTILRNLAELGR